MFMKQVQDDFCFVTWCVIMLDVAIKRWVDCGHEDMHTVSNNTGIHLDGLVLAGPKCAKKTFPTSHPPAWTVHTGQVGSTQSRC